MIDYTNRFETLFNEKEEAQQKISDLEEKLKQVHSLYDRSADEKQ